jgi:hypothetical protein
VKPPFSPSAAIAEVCALLKGYNVASVMGDKYAPGFVAEGFPRHRVRYAYSERDRSQIYVEALPLLTSGRARLIDSKKLALQFASLERRTSPGGRDRIDHGLNGHDDLSNAAAGRWSRRRRVGSRCGSARKWWRRRGGRAGAPSFGRVVCDGSLARSHRDGVGGLGSNPERREGRRSAGCMGPPVGLPEATGTR